MFNVVLGDFHCRVAYVVLLTTSLFCALLRACNFASLDKQRFSQLFPARKTMIVFFLSPILIAPHAIHPHSLDAWLYVRSFWLLIIPVMSRLALRSFFCGSGRRIPFYSLLWLGVSCVCFLVMMIGAFVGGSTLSDQCPWMENLVLVCGIGLFLLYAQVCVRLYRRMLSDSHQLYSNINDFPSSFALKMIVISFLMILLAWVVFLSDNHTLYFLSNFVYAIMVAVLLVLVLYPHRNLADVQHESVQNSQSDPASSNAPSFPSTKEPSESLPIDLLNRIEQQLKRLMENEQLYLDPDLTRSSLSKQLGVNEQHLYYVLKLRFGSFYKYVNTLRMNHAIDYVKHHPTAKNEEVALNSGFGSVRSYYRIKKLFETNRLD